MEVFDVDVFFEDELPFGVSIWAVVSRGQNLKFVVFEVHLSADGDDLSSVPNNAE